MEKWFLEHEVINKPFINCSFFSFTFQIAPFKIEYAGLRRIYVTDLEKKLALLYIIYDIQST